MRQCSEPSNHTVVRIMWTNTLGWRDRSKEFIINHFVPLFKRGDQTSGGQVKDAKRTEEVSDENENPWHVVTNK